MRKITSIILAALSIITTNVVASDYVEGEVIVRYASLYSPNNGNPTPPGLATVLSAYGVYEDIPLCIPTERPETGHPDGVWTLAEWDNSAEDIKLYDWFLLRYSAPIDSMTVATELASTRYFREADVNYKIESQATLPNDPLFYMQWHLYSPPNDGDIQAGEGWDYLNEVTRNIKIGIVDTGIWASEPRSYANIHVDIKNNVDAGAINDLDVFPFYEGDNAFHGTMLSGLISAVTNNATGVAGVTWNRGKLVITNHGKTAFGAAKGIVFCANHYAEVVNLSWTMDNYSAVVRKAIEHCDGLDLNVVSSMYSTYAYQSGYEKWVYPACDNLVIGVAGNEPDGDFWNYSCWYPGQVFCMAPTFAIETTIPYNGYNFFTTSNSVATAQVSGVLAMIRAKKPGSYPNLNEWAENELKKSCKHPYSYDDQEGWGLVSLLKALQPAIIDGFAGADNSPNSPLLTVYPNFPNPVTESTMIRFVIGGEITATIAKLDIYDISGRKVDSREEPLNGSGEYSISWSKNTDIISAGVYIYKLEVGEESVVRKMVVK